MAKKTTKTINTKDTQDTMETQATATETPKAKTKKPLKAKTAKTKVDKDETLTIPNGTEEQTNGEDVTPRSPGRPRLTEEGPTGGMNAGQIRFLRALVEAGQPLTGRQLSDAANVHPTMVGNQVGYRKPEINDRPMHKGNLLNRGYVKIQQHDDGKKGVFFYVVTPAGKKALEKADKAAAKEKAQAAKEKAQGNGESKPSKAKVKA